MNEKNFNALEVCLQALETGASVEGCLALYPALSEELRPVLEGALAARSLSSRSRSENDIPLAAQQRSAVNLLALAAQLRSEGQANPLTRFWSRITEPLLRSFQVMRPAAGRLAVALVLALAFVLTSSGLLVVSAESLPGDALYPVKRAFEDLRVSLASGSEAQHSMEVSYSQQRVAEVMHLIDLGRRQMVSFEGIVEVISPNQWVVSGMTIRISPETVYVNPGGVNQPIMLGNLIEVEGFTNPEGWVDAREIHLREYQFSGVLEEITFTQWVVSQVSLEVNQDSQIDPGLSIGSPVVVLARSEDSGALVALAILRYGTEIPDLQPSVNVTAQSVVDLTVTPSPSPTAVVTVEDDEVEFSGRVMVMNSDFWIVGGQIIYVTGATEIDDSIIVGSLVRVKADLEPNGSLTAEDIDLDDDGSDDADGDGGDGDGGDDGGGDGDDGGGDDGDGDSSGSGSGDDDPEETEEPEEP